MKAIFTYIDDNGEENKEVIEGVIVAYKNREVQYPNGEWCSSFIVESRIEDVSMQFDLVPGAKLEFTGD